MDTTQAKAHLREKMIARRDTAASDPQAFIKQFIESGLPLLRQHNVQVLAGFWPMGNETDILPLMRHVADEGITIGLPVVVAKGAPLIFRHWQPDAAMEKGVWDIPIPSDTTEVTPDALLVPLLAFDMKGDRLGYGGGFYDRTLQLLRENGQHPLSIGIAFECQKVDDVPCEDWDEKLDMVITDEGSYSFAKSWVPK